MILKSNISKKIILLFDDKNREIIFIRYIFGTLTIVGNSKTYKIEINKNALSKEILNREYIKNKYGLIYDILLPLEIKKKFIFLYLESNTIQNLNNELDIISSYKYICNVFNKNLIENKSIYIKNFSNIIESIKFISRDNNEFDTLKNLFVSIFNNEKYLVPSHGDLHIGNILKNNNEYYLIDLDCFRNMQFVWMDEIYFVIELIVFEKKVENISWIEIIEKVIKGDKILFKYKKYFNKFNLENPYLQLLVYLLDRLEQEKTHTKHSLENIHKIIDLINWRIK
ncbi:hypothetical protein [Aliarcobacter cryaerophilus]|uniref:hypothetical protein n=1 Tax=Aliarcobacter cryaerophilus TaxID=28198 RepID=UPI003DA58906